VTRSFDRVEVGCIRRQVAEGQPLPRSGELPEASDLVNVEIFPYEDDGAPELLACGDQQIAVATPGELLRPSRLPSSRRNR
jgi:hypothetical protein